MRFSCTHACAPAVVRQAALFRFGRGKDFDGIGRIEADYGAAFHENIGRLVVRAGRAEKVVESRLVRPWLDLWVVVIDGAVAEAEMPLANDARIVARIAEHPLECRLLRGKDVGAVPCFVAPPVVASGQNAVARRLADCRGSMRIGKSQSLGSQPVDIRGLD